MCLPSFLFWVREDGEACQEGASAKRCFLGCICRRKNQIQRHRSRWAPSVALNIRGLESGRSVQGVLLSGVQMYPCQEGVALNPHMGVELGILWGDDIMSLGNIRLHPSIAMLPNCDVAKLRSCDLVVFVVLRPRDFAISRPRDFATSRSCGGDFVPIWGGGSPPFGDWRRQPPDTPLRDL